MCATKTIARMDTSPTVMNYGASSTCTSDIASKLEMKIGAANGRKKTYCQQHVCI